jgi:hypothetical protein
MDMAVNEPDPHDTISTGSMSSFKIEINMIPRMSLLVPGRPPMNHVTRFIVSAFTASTAALSRGICQRLEGSLYLPVLPFRSCLSSSDSISRVIVDRYALPSGADPTRCDTGKRTWCGGTWST